MMTNYMTFFLMTDGTEDSSSPRAGLLVLLWKGVRETGIKRPSAVIDHPGATYAQCI